MSNGKVMIIFLTVGLIKNICYKYKMGEQNFRPHKSCHDINVNLNLSNYATKEYLNTLENSL